MILIIDNYDSFTFNLVHFLGEMGVACEVWRNDQISVADALALAPDGVILSPGPGVPDNAGICLDVVRDAPESLPILGVCLGHQVIGQAFGGRIMAAPTIMHGKRSPIHHQQNGLFVNVPPDFLATRYHSLVLAPDSVPDCLTITAHTDDGVIMGVQHKSRPVFGVQFHPESIATLYGHALLANFLRFTPVTPQEDAITTSPLETLGAG